MFSRSIKRLDLMMNAMNKFRFSVIFVELMAFADFLKIFFCIFWTSMFMKVINRKVGRFR